MAKPRRIEPWLDKVRGEVNIKGLEEARELRDMSREQVARMWGISMATVLRWEHGQTKPQQVYKPMIVAFIEETNRLIARAAQDYIIAPDDPENDPRA